MFSGLSKASPWARQEKSLAQGLSVWILFSLFAVLLRGVRWEESYEHALVISRLCPYPEGHPDFRFLRNLFSLQSYLSAAFVYLIKSPALICGLRNFLQIFFSLAPVYLFSFLFTRRQIWAHSAVLLFLTASHVFFQSYYPIVVWPEFYSVGQIGLGYALVSVWAIAAQYRRLGWFLIALMPAIHIGQWPIVLILGILDALWRYATRTGPPAKGASFSRLYSPAAAAILGALCVGVFYLLLGYFHVEAPLGGPYAATGESQSIFQDYARIHDVHRQFPRWNPFAHSVIIMGFALYFFSMAAYREGQGQCAFRPYLILSLYTFGVIAAVSIAKSIHTYMGDATPFIILGWMPYRLPNHLPPLVLAGMVGVLCADPQAPGEKQPNSARLVLSTLLVALAIFSASFWASDWLTQRYLSAPGVLFFFMMGLSSFSLWRRLPERRALFAGLGALGFVALAYYHQFAAALLLLGLFSSLVLECAPRPHWLSSRQMRITLITVSLLLLGLLLHGQWRERTHLPKAEIQQRIEEYLAERKEEDAMLLTPYWDVEWLCRTAHPIMADYQTAHRMTYIPSLAPSLKKMHQELYGVVIDQEDSGLLDDWERRSLSQWQALSERYAFDYVVSPIEIELPLKEIFSAGQHRFYRVPIGSGRPFRGPVDLILRPGKKATDSSTWQKRHSREGGNLGVNTGQLPTYWIPAFAGMTQSYDLEGGEY